MDRYWASYGKQHHQGRHRIWTVRSSHRGKWCLGCGRTRYAYGYESIPDTGPNRTYSRDIAALDIIHVETRSLDTTLAAWRYSTTRTQQSFISIHIGEIIIRPLFIFVGSGMIDHYIHTGRERARSGRSGRCRLRVEELGRTLLVCAATATNLSQIVQMRDNVYTAFLYFARCSPHACKMSQTKLLTARVARAHRSTS